MTWAGGDVVFTACTTEAPCTVVGCGVFRPGAGAHLPLLVLLSCVSTFVTVLSMSVLKLSVLSTNFLKLSMYVPGCSTCDCVAVAATAAVTDAAAAADIGVLRLVLDDVTEAPLLLDVVGASTRAFFDTDV